MKTIKRIAAPMIAAVLCLLIAMSSIPVASALSVPQAPSKVLYRSDYAIDEHCLIITPKSVSTGFQVQAINVSGKTTYNKYFKANTKSKEFYKLGKDYIVWNFHKNIANGQFYTVKVRAFNASNYKSGTKPSSAKYSGWTSTYAAETVKGAKAVRVDKNNIRISWNKTAGATCYTLRYAFVDNKAVAGGKTVSATSTKLSKIGKVSLKNAKKIILEIVPVKLSKYAYHGADWKFHNLTIK